MSVGCVRLFALALFALPLAGCDGPAQPAERLTLNVLAKKVVYQPYDVTITLTGAVRARVQTELSFRVSGRVIERKGDVGQHVEADAVLAKLDPSEQQADVEAAKAALEAAEATMRQSAAVYERQKTLLVKGFTTQANYDAADRSRLTAVGSLDAAKAQLGSAKDALTYTQLRAGHPGVITDRYIEVGQVAQAGDPAFGFAQDGPRDVVFAVYESIVAERRGAGNIQLSLVSDPKIKAQGRVREVSPAVDAKNGTVQVKVEIEPGAPPMPLGAAVTGEAHWQEDNVVVLPWTTMASKDGQPAVWVIDQATMAVSLRPIVVEVYEKDKTVVRAGLQAGELVVTAGGQFLREGQIVRIETPEPS